MRLHLCLFSLVFLIGCLRTDDRPAATPPAVHVASVQEIAAGYTKLKLMTKEPVYVDARLASLCRGALQEELETARKNFGPHAHAAISIYMNDLAADAFAASSKPFPVGSAIVKEKKALSYWKNGNPSEITQPHDGVGGMIKRPAGYDPKNGDWEYFYFEDVTKIESGKLTSCVQCHAGAVGKDYVFGGWASRK